MARKMKYNAVKRKNYYLLLFARLAMLAR